jgi:hypothetical protein
MRQRPGPTVLFVLRAMTIKQELGAYESDRLRSDRSVISAQCPALSYSQLSALNSD